METFKAKPSLLRVCDPKLHWLRQSILRPGLLLLLLPIILVVHVLLFLVLFGRCPVLRLRLRRRARRCLRRQYPHLEP